MQESDEVSCQVTQYTCTPNISSLQTAACCSCACPQVYCCVSGTCTFLSSLKAGPYCSPDSRSCSYSCTVSLHRHPMERLQCPHVTLAVLSANDRKALQLPATALGTDAQSLTRGTQSIVCVVFVLLPVPRDDLPGDSSVDSLRVDRSFSWSLSSPILQRLYCRLPTSIRTMCAAFPQAHSRHIAHFMS